MVAPPPYDPLQQAKDLMTQNRRDDALAELYRLVVVQPDNRDAWWLITTLAPNAAQQQDALRRTLAIDPTYPPALEMAAHYGIVMPPPSTTAATRASIDVQQLQQAPTQIGSVPPPSSMPPQSMPPQYQPQQQYGVQPPPPLPEPLYADEPPSRPTRRFDETPIERSRGSIQPLLVINGGCSSGCFSLVLTLFVLTIMGVLLIGGAVNEALRMVGALQVGESYPADVLPAVALTGLLMLASRGSIVLPLGLTNIDLSQFAAESVDALWGALNYPANTGTVIVERIAALGPRLNAANWLPPVMFFAAWFVLAFFFVFMRARSMRFIHWLLSTIGVWLGVVAAVLLASLLVNLFF